jgi:hypothetical protein
MAYNYNYPDTLQSTTSWHNDKNIVPTLTSNTYFKIHNRVILLNELLAYSDKLYSKDRDEFEKTYKMAVESTIEDIAYMFVEQEKEAYYYISYGDNDDEDHGDLDDGDTNSREKFNKYKEMGRKIMREIGFKYA